MKTIAVVLLTLLGGDRVSCLQLDIVIVADFSSSVQGYEGYIFKAIHDFADSFQMDDEEVRIGVVAFNTEAYVPLQITGRRKDLDAFLTENNLFCTGTTNMDAGLRTAYEQLGIAYEGLADRSDSKKIIILISDGEADSPDKTFLVANDIKNGGVDIWGILIASPSARPAEMRLYSSPNKFVSTDYERLGEELNKLNFCL